VSARAVRWLLSLIAPRGNPRSGPSRLTIVRHHRVYADGERPLYALGVSASVFEAQLAACGRAGLVPVSVRAGLERLRRGTPGHAIAFSFDDGYADNVTRALPALRRHGAAATFYLTAGLMEERRAPWWDELVHALEHAATPRARVTLGAGTVAVDVTSPAGRAAALAALLPAMRVAPGEQRARLDALRVALGVREAPPCELAEWPLASRLVAEGMEVGAHTLGHPFLTLLPAEEQRRELADSAALIRARTGGEVTGAAYPNGDHDAVTVAAVGAAGLEYAVTTRAGDCTSATAFAELPRRALTAGACTDPLGRFSARMVLAELAGTFDGLRGRRMEAAS
jgi:peptidoglycan/xylan/chitin deacetylase (PgdA/CDA1 family)